MPRCANCGLLALRDPSTNELIAVDEEPRETGRFPSFRVGETGSWPLRIGVSPRCAARQFDLPSEIEKAAEVAKAKGTDPSNVYFEIIALERQCPAFCKWHPGFSPKEHREMLFDLEKTKLEMTRREQDRKYEADQRERDRKHEAEQKTGDRWWQAWCTLIGALIGAVATLVATALAQK